MSTRITSLDYSHPYRPPLIRTVNAFGSAWNKVVPDRSLEMEHLLRAASHAEKHDNFGNEHFIEPLEVLLSSIEREAQLNFFGRFVTQKRLLNLLRNRLKVAKLLKEHPEINDITLPPVILITGLQRTGTTMLHRLLNVDPQNRALMSWEALHPAPLSLDFQEDKKKKLKTARQAQNALRFLAPDFFAIHPVEAESPEEDVLLLDYALISTVAESTMHVPTYAKWVEQADHKPAYEYMQTLLKVLSWKHPQQTWILKSPHHLEFLDDFLHAFDNSTVVMTHRDPLETLPSFCSMMSHGRAIFTDHIDPKQVGAQWLRKTGRMLTRGHTTRDNTNNTEFVDIYYKDLIAEPFNQIRRIYEAANKPMGNDVLQAMKENSQLNGQHRYGVHQYRMEPFGLTQEMIFETYNNYMQRYFPGELS